MGKIVCPPECQEKHMDSRVMMAEINTELKNIKLGQQELKDMISKFTIELDKKADKSEVERLKDKLDGKIEKDEERADKREEKWYQKESNISTAIISLLLGIIGFLLYHIFFK